MINVEYAKYQGIYIVTEIIYSFKDSKITKWYYDMDKLLISEDINFPEGMLTRKLSDEQIKWFNDYYLPKAITI
jgi:hypothetical protein